MSLIALIGAAAFTTLIILVLATSWNSFRTFRTHPVQCLCRLIFEKIEMFYPKSLHPIKIISTMLYNLMLLYIITNIYDPKSCMQIVLLSLILATTHFLLEWPHVAHMDGSYKILAINMIAHLIETIISVCLLKYYFEIMMQSEDGGKEVNSHQKSQYKYKYKIK